jgi:hypothetical protein
LKIDNKYKINNRDMMYPKVGIAHTFVVPLTYENHLTVEKIKLRLEYEGGFWEEGSCGEFMIRDRIGKIQGYFQVNVDYLQLTIYSKPVIASYSFVEERFYELIDSLQNL